MTHEQIASDLLTPAWRGISDTYKRKYARNIWQQFEDNIRAAAYTGSLAKFFGNFCERMAVEIRAEHVEHVNSVLVSGEDRAVLRLLREDATALVLLVRLANEEKRREYLDRQEARRAERELADNPPAEPDTLIGDLFAANGDDQQS